MTLPAQYFQKLVESCPDIIISVDTHGTIIFYNDGARQNLGFAYEEVLGKNVLEIYPSIEEARRVMAAMRSNSEAGKGRVCNFETSFKTKKGDKVPVAISASIIYDDQGKEVGSIGFAKDIREIRRRDRLVTLGEIAVGLSHEINNSLEVLVNQVEMVKRYVERVATDQDYIVEADRVDAIASQVKKIQSITTRIGSMADEGEYGTKEYIGGKLMTDLRVGGADKPCERPSPDARFPLSGLKILRRGDEDARRGGAGRGDGVAHVGEHRDAVDVGPRLLRAGAGHDLRAVGTVQLAVEAALASGQALVDDLGVLVDEDAHVARCLRRARRPCSPRRAWWAASAAGRTGAVRGSCDPRRRWCRRGGSRWGRRSAHARAPARCRWRPLHPW